MVADVEKWGRTRSLAQILNELNEAKPGDELYLPEKSNHHGGNYNNSNNNRGGAAYGGKSKSKAKSKSRNAYNSWWEDEEDEDEYDSYFSQSRSSNQASFTFAQAKSAYRKALMRVHPDKHMHDPEAAALATERFKALTNAFKAYEAKNKDN
jgi:hypothetical protein